MATFAIGDVHGNREALDDLLARLEGEVQTHDTVVFLGDYIDRGPHSKGCVDAILKFQREAQTEVVCLMGNHEDWFLRTFRDYKRHSWLLGMEAFATIRSYSPDAERVLREAVSSAGPELYLGGGPLPYEVFFERVPLEHIRFFENLRLFHRSADCVCTHGGLDPGVSGIEEQTRHALIWGADTFPDGYEGEEVVVYGHRNNAVLQPDGWPVPRIAGRTIGVDTISHGVLTAVRVPDEHVFQSARYNVP